jgi:hypothetical protein
MRRRKDYFFDSGERDEKGIEFISCPEGGEPLVIEDGGDGRLHAFCYRHVIACYIGKGWETEKARGGD